MTCSPTCCPPGACAASPASSNARCPTLGSRRALTATGPSRPSHPPKPSPSDEPDPRQTHNATALSLGRFLPLVATRATPVVIEPLNRASAGAAFERFGCDPRKEQPACVHRLLYMGQANGMVVIYNSSEQRTIFA